MYLNRLRPLLLLTCGLVLTACTAGRRENVVTDGVRYGSDGVTVKAGGIEVHGVGVDFATTAAAKPAHLRVLRKDTVVHEATAKPDGTRLRFPDFRVDGITPGLASEPGHLNEVRIEIGLGPEQRCSWTLNDADLGR
jgi:hypothetical protein